MASRRDVTGMVVNGWDSGNYPQVARTQREDGGTRWKETTNIGFQQQKSGFGPEEKWWKLVSEE